jgi:hypothetical protein
VWLSKRFFLPLCDFLLIKTLSGFIFQQSHLLFFVFEAVAEGRKSVRPTVGSSFVNSTREGYMGKAARQRRIKRMKYLARLAQEDPERFEKEWERRLFSWLETIRRDAGRMKDGKGRAIPAVFERVEDAMAVLESCGEATYRKYAGEAWELLSTECCRSFGHWVDRNFYRLARQLECTT